VITETVTYHGKLFKIHYNKLSKVIRKLIIYT